LKMTRLLRQSGSWVVPRSRLVGWGPQIPDEAGEDRHRDEVGGGDRDWNVMADGSLSSVSTAVTWPSYRSG
jgi:hypothetical protein